MPRFLLAILHFHWANDIKGDDDDENNNNNTDSDDDDDGNDHDYSNNATYKYRIHRQIFGF